jgi:hypothetical protein
MALGVEFSFAPFVCLLVQPGAGARNAQILPWSS